MPAERDPQHTAAVQGTRTPEGADTDFPSDDSLWVL